MRWRTACAALAAAGMLVVPASPGLAHGGPAPSAPYSVPASLSALVADADLADADFPELQGEITARLDAAIEKVRVEAGVPGVAVALSAPGKGEYIRAFGVADKVTEAPMTSDMNTRIGSVTKTFTVTALLELVDRGEVGLDDPISDYIDGVPDGDGITLRQLADMRSGLFNYSLDEDFDKALTSDPDRPFTPQELLDYSFKHPLQFQPGEKFDYSNTNLILLGLVVEQVGGQPLNEFITDEVLEPAGLHHTLFPTGAEFPSPHAQGYTNDTASGQIEDATDWDPTWAWAAGAMISDLDDLRSWAKTLATGTLLTPATQAERLETPPTGISGAGYGLGIFDVQGWLGHNGSLPGYQTLVLYLPESQATLVVTLNTDVADDGIEPSTLFGRAITEIVTPDHVYNLPKPVSSPSASPSG